MKYKIIATILFLLSIKIQIHSQTTGFIPLNDLGSGTYKGYQGGFYPNGLNVRPVIHDSVGLYFSKQIKPLDQNGNTDPANGKIVLLSIGMSNTTQEFSMFKSIADTDRTKNPKLVIVDGAQGGQTAAVISDSTANFWKVIDQRLANAKVTRVQIQIAWVKEADAGPTQAFPIHVNTLVREFVSIAQILKARYPNIKIAYWSSRTYGGYATTNLNPEPYAYESGFAVKWLIEKQINGDTLLAYSGTKPKSPWLSWGPYLWADGINPRSDGLVWNIDDFVTSDRTHPSPSGRLKVANLLLKFLKTDTTAKDWFTKSQATSVTKTDAPIPAHIILEQNYPNPFRQLTNILFQIPERAHISLTVYDLFGIEHSKLIDDELLPGGYSQQLNAASLPTGIYFYRLCAGTYSQTRMLTVHP